MKTHKGAVNRTKVSSQGVPFRMAQRQNHLLQKKSSTNRIKKRNLHLVADPDVKKLKILLPYDKIKSKGELKYRRQVKQKTVA